MGKRKIEERVLRWETSSRYYAARLRQDLLSDWVLERSWGGRYNNIGGADTITVITKKAGEEALAALHKRRTSRHYELVADKVIRH